MNIVIFILLLVTPGVICAGIIKKGKKGNKCHL